MNRTLWLLLWTLFFAAACSYSEKITDGRTAHERKQYAIAIPMLEKEYAKAKENRQQGEIAYRLGECYQRTNQYSKAAEWYEKAIVARFGQDEALQQARMYQQLERYDDAVRSFQSAGREMGDVNYYREQINACRNAKIWLQKTDSSEYSLQSLPFNGANNDFAAALYQKDSLLFSSDRASAEKQPQKGKNTPYKWTNKPFFDFYTAPSARSNASPSATPATALPFNNEYHQGTPSFSAAGTEMYFTQCGGSAKTGTDYCKIMRSELKDGKWTTAEEQSLGEAGNNYLHPHLAELPNGGKMLYFSANLSTGYGGYDLYSSVWLEKEQKWAQPRNLGNSVNSKGNEAFPFMQADTLYFSSDGLPTMGGLDIFRAERNTNSGKWANVRNLQAPINSGGDDFGIFFVPNAQDFRRDDSDTMLYQVGFLSSNRISNFPPRPNSLNQISPKGGDDLYRFERRYPTIPPPADTPKIVDTAASPKARILLVGIVKEKRYKTAGNPNSGVLDSLPLAGASVQISTEDTVFTLGVEEAGDFSIALNENTDYTLRASKENYFNNSANVSTKNLGWTVEKGDTTLRVEITLDRIFAGQEIVLENIYYDYNDDKIRADARPSLDALVEILQRNPQISIQLGSHTDCRGSDTYNQSLSQRRAESAVRYLQEKGINPSRLKARGYGESSPAEVCKCAECTEAQHQANRRTTFMVLE